VRPRSIGLTAAARLQRVLRSEQVQLASAPRISREVVVYALVTVLASTIWLWPHLLHFRQVPDRGDPIFSAWRLARFAHQLGTDPARLLDGNIFYPLPLTLTYSDATILQGILGTPLLWLGVEPLVVANALFFLAFPSCGLAFFYTSWRLTADPRAGLIAGVLGAWYPFHGEHYSHLELQWFMFVPIALLALLQLMARPTVRRGAAFGCAVAAQWLASMYIGVMLMTLLIPFGLVIWVAWRCRPSAPLVGSLVVASAVVVTVCAMTGLPYVKSRAIRGDRTLAALAPGSAVPLDYFDTHRRLASYQWHSRADNHPERELYPGTSPLILALAGVILAPGAVTLALTCSAVAAFEWSLGVNGVTYPWLYKLLLPYQGMRVPARFSVLLGSCLILLGGYGTHAWLRRLRPATATVVLVTIATLVLLDLRLTTTLVNYWPASPDMYEGVTPEMVLAEFPTGRDVDYMYFSTTHWAHLLGGYSGYIPSDPRLDSIRQLFPSREAFASLRARGATHITYNCAFERSTQRCAHTLEQLDRTSAVSLVTAARWNGAEVRLYRLTDGR
jgi:hypothetical protein